MSLLERSILRSGCHGNRIHTALTGAQVGIISQAGTYLLCLRSWGTAEELPKAIVRGICFCGDCKEKGNKSVKTIRGLPASDDKS